jgi:hypothetical protein
MSRRRPCQSGVTARSNDAGPIGEPGKSGSEEPRAIFLVPFRGRELEVALDPNRLPTLTGLSI